MIINDVRCCIPLLLLLLLLLLLHATEHGCILLHTAAGAGACQRRAD
jgi:hypothetical protein